MEVVKLTNLGHLTLRNLLKLNEEYRENESPKRKKLSKLWASEQDIDVFQELFHHPKSIDRLLIKEGDLYLIKGIESQENFLLNPDGVKIIQRFQEMSLVRSYSTNQPLEDVIEAIQKEEYLNPIKYLQGVTLELTGLCNLKCKHCYRGGSREGEYGLPVEEIKKALEPLLRSGIKHLTITGGEPTLRRKDLIEIVDYASQYLELKGVSIEERLQYKFGASNPTIEDVLKSDKYIKMRAQLMKQLLLPKDKLRPGDWNICSENTPNDVERIVNERAKSDLEYTRQPSNFDLDSIGILSNGFFGNQRKFIRRLKSYGNVSIQTSLDSYNEQITDKHRGRKGVFAHVKNLVQITNEEGFDLFITAHNIDGEKTAEAKKNAKYFDKQSSMKELSGILQLGNAVQESYKAKTPFKDSNMFGVLSPNKRHADGWCKGFTRPDKLHIRPTGNVGNCLYAYALPDEMGNLHQMSMAEIVNGIQDTKVYQMFKDGRIERYQHELDKSLFPKQFSRSCEPLVLTLTYGIIKERLIAQGIQDPIKKANEEVAKLYKFMK